MTNSNATSLNHRQGGSNSTGSKSSSSNSPTLLFKPPVVYKSCLVGMVAGKLWLWPSAPAIVAAGSSTTTSSWMMIPTTMVVGISLFGGGVAIASHAKKTFQFTKTPMMDGPAPNGVSPLHTRGDFAWTRNPMYLGISVALVGAALMTNNTWNLSFPLLNWIIMDQYFIPLEEVQMEKAFGEEYKKYKTRVRRWI